MVLTYFFLCDGFHRTWRLLQQSYTSRSRCGGGKAVSSECKQRRRATYWTTYFSFCVLAISRLPSNQQLRHLNSPPRPYKNIRHNTGHIVTATKLK